MLFDLLNKMRIAQLPESRKLNIQQKKFQNILEFAQAVLEHSRSKNIYKQYSSKGNEHPILDVVRLVGKTTQTKYLTSLIYCNDESELPGISSGQLFFDQSIPITNDGKRAYQLMKEEKSTKEIQLHKDLILPWPWKRERLINAISYIGDKRVRGGWKQDFDNHYTDLWLPIGVTWVNGGNHSIASGIIQGGGTIKPENTFNISELYKHIFTDGKYYFRKIDNTVIAPVEDVEFAAIFEIGRLMIMKGISF
ncbi:DUF6710 family protein [Paenibacillus sp. FSL E2-0201]|uniref:DUF6710 family protein n=1 Tax=Paenibacillus sp. FSL E2-0201 TaxID=2954726 RepID=UPI0030DBCBA0